jgi:hypothetical protein
MSFLYCDCPDCVEQTRRIRRNRTASGAPIVYSRRLALRLLLATSKAKE